MYKNIGEAVLVTRVTIFQQKTIHSLFSLDSTWADKSPTMSWGMRCGVGERDNFIIKTALHPTLKQKIKWCMCYC